MTLAMGCASISQQLNPTVYYKNDLFVTVNEESGRGTLTVPVAEKYTVTVQSHDPIHMIKWATCHREGSTEEVKGSLFRSPGKTYAFDLYPSEIEKMEACPLKIETYTRDASGRHGSAFVEFGNERLDFTVHCNGSAIQSVNGVAICESAEGLIQDISFSEPVFVESSDRCKIGPKELTKSFQFKTPNRECVHVFMSPNGPRGRMISIGYEQIAIRGD